MTEEQQETTETVEEPQEGTESEQQTFPATYVRELRQEAAEHRVRAQESDKYRDALRAAVLKSHSAGLLREPLPWSDDLNDPETGLPDEEKVTEAVQALAAEKPWLARPAGDIGTGFRGDQSDAVSLGDMLRAGA